MKKKGLDWKALAIWQPVAVRIVLFALLIFVAVPLLTRYLDVQAPIQANYIYIVLFSLLVIGMFVLLNKESLRKHRFRGSLLESALFLGAGLVFFGLHFSAKYLVSSNFAHRFPTLYFLWSGFLYLMMVLLFMFAVFGYQFMAGFKRQLVVAFSIIIPYYSITMVLRSYWLFFSGWIVQANVWLLKLVYFNVPDLAVSYSLVGDPQFSLEGFDVVIGGPCSGIDSLMMFTGFFILVALLDWRKFDKVRLLALYPIGLFGMFSMSVLRIFALMNIGAFYDPRLALSLFHDNLGWLFFVGYFFVFLYFAYPFMKKRPALSHSTTRGRRGK